jgi:hypothetical protein
MRLVKNFHPVPFECQPRGVTRADREEQYDPGDHSFTSDSLLNGRPAWPNEPTANPGFNSRLSNKVAKIVRAGAAPKIFSYPQAAGRLPHLCATSDQSASQQGALFDHLVCARGGQAVRIDRGQAKPRGPGIRCRVTSRAQVRSRHRASKPPRCLRSRSAEYPGSPRSTSPDRPIPGRKSGRRFWRSRAVH